MPSLSAYSIDLTVTKWRWPPPQFKVKKSLKSSCWRCITWLSHHCCQVERFQHASSSLSLSALGMLLRAPRKWQTYWRERGKRCNSYPTVIVDKSDFNILCCPAQFSCNWQGYHRWWMHTAYWEDKWSLIRAGTLLALQRMLKGQGSLLLQSSRHCSLLQIVNLQPMILGIRNGE